VHERRFPLLIGLRAFRLLAILPASLLLAAAVSQTLYYLGPDLPYGNIVRAVGLTGSVVALGMCISPFALLFAAGFIYKRLRRAISVRACDALLSPEGLRIQGGTAHGFSASWASLAVPGGVRWERDGLWLRDHDQRWLHVPLGTDEDEKVSVEALGATIAAYASAISQGQGQGGTEPPRRGPPSTILCSGCGAPQAPAAAATVSCHYCGQQNAVPAELADKMRAMRALAHTRAREERLAAAVIAQRSARVANLVAFAGGLLMMAASALTLLGTGMLVIVDGQESGLPRLSGFGVAAAGAALLLLSAVLYILASRRALRLLTMGFAALSPARPGDPPACRECFGPLPDPGSDSALARCGYCDAINVMAADLRLQANIVGRFVTRARDPYEVLAVCAGQRRRARFLAVLGLGLFVGGGAWLGRAGPNWQSPASASANSLPYKEEEPMEYGEVLPGLGAARVERVGLLPEPARGQLMPDGHGGVTLRPLVNSEGLHYPTTWFDDPILLDTSPAPHGAVLATTRASTQGHLRVRLIEPNGKSRVLLTDARDPMLSPDGRELAVALLVGDRLQIGVASFAHPDAPRVLTRGPGQGCFPIFSPDGKRLAFLTRTVRDAIHFTKRYSQSHLWMVDENGQLHRLTEGVSLQMIRPLWTPEGIWVVAKEGRPSQYQTVLYRVVPR
jgi:hypothetical protein